MTRWIPRIGLAILSFAIVFAIFELALRALDPSPSLLHFGSPRIYQADGDLIYSRRPSVGRDTNSLGLRGLEISRSPSGKRIIALGDSYTYGFNVPPLASYPALLGRELRRRGSFGPNAEVINAGIPGYNADQAYALFTQRLHVLDPDWVVFIVEPKDLAGANVLYDIEDGELVPVSAWKNWIYLQLGLRSATPEWLKKTRLYDFLLGRLTGRDPFGALPSEELDQQITWQIQKIGLLVEALVAQGKEEGFEVLVVNYPDQPALLAGGDYTKSSYFGLPVSILGPRANEHMNRLRDVLLAGGAHFTDAMQVFLDRRFAGTEIESLYLSNDPHMSERGNQVLAEILADSLTGAAEPSERAGSPLPGRSR